MEKTVDEIVKDIIGEARSWNESITFGKKANGNFFVKKDKKIFYEGPNGEEASKSLLDVAKDVKELK